MMSNAELCQAVQSTLEVAQPDVRGEGDGADHVEELLPLVRDDRILMVFMLLAPGADSVSAMFGSPVTFSGQQTYRQRRSC